VQGLRVQCPEDGSFAPGEWVENEGIVVSKEFYNDCFLKNVTVPMIRATRADRAEHPSTIYSTRHRASLRSFPQEKWCT
jgi:uncharacterized membrane protein YcgQ (UPF0703/DUF1980 family)